MNYKLWGKIAVATGFISAVIYLIISAAMSPLFRVSGLDIQLSEESSQGILFNKIKDTLDARFKNLRGEYVWKVDIEDVLRKVQGDLRVKEAKVTRLLPNRVLVSVTPYTPIASIMANSSDRMYPISRDGEVLPPLDAAEIPDGPILRGEMFLRDATLRQDALKLLLSLPEHGSLSLSQISELQFDKKRGFVMTVTPGGVDVWMGFSDYARHASQAQRVLDYLKVQRLTGRIIDARLGKKVVVRLRNAP
jgi:cell division septal protein FtsQ